MICNITKIAVSSALAFFMLLAVPQQVFSQTKSKSKSSEKLYDKEGINVLLKNAVLINTPQLEFSPAFYQNGIVFVSSRFKNGAVDEKIGETFFELFYAQLDKNGNPLAPESFSVTINSQLHEGPVTFDRGGTLMYFTRNNSNQGVSKADSKDVSRIKIYEATKGKFDWENVKELPFNNDEYSCFHPSLSPDGRRLYFSSDMPGGYGGYDLYFAERRGNSWSTPINLGPEINSPGNEAFPFIHESGYLFFSSNGRKDGIGGLDVYMINIGSSSWGEVSNLGRPFNSPNDDLGFILDEEGDYGFFASDRAGGYGKDDIYRFELPDGIKGINSKMKLSSKIIAYDAETNERIEGAGVRIFERTANGFIEGDDTYDVQLMPRTSSSQELVMKLVQKQPSDIGEPSIFTNANGEVDAQLKAEKNYVIVTSKSGFSNGEITYSTMGETGTQTIRIAMRPQVCATLEGSVFEASRSTAGVPFAVVRIVNECDNQEQVIRTNADGDFEYCVPLGCKYMLYVEKEGYGRGVKSVTTENMRLVSERPIQVEVGLNPIVDAFRNKPLEEGTIIVLEQIYYDFNKSAIRTGDARELDALAKLMLDYPTMEIEMVAHTDSRGSEEYNLELSLRRAESAKKYLVSRGVSENRIQALGRGESQLRNSCKDGVNCSEEEHQYNRRTEVKVSRISEPVRIEYRSNE